MKSHHDLEFKKAKKSMRSEIFGVFVYLIALGFTYVPRFMYHVYEANRRDPSTS